MRRRPLRMAGAALVALAVVLAWATAAEAQYFGRNKVQYRTFNFQILSTAHFDIYYYPEEAEAANTVSRLAERWYSRLSRFFGHELRGRQAVILYAVPAHFQQTNAIEGIIGEGTGGVTEGLRRRIVLPVAGSLADTDHVMGHELVHAFQFDITGADPRDKGAGAPGILAYPLWFVEGMAEYVSLGPVDAQTAMWLRDAALREKLPKIKDLDDPKYFPYRWGHAFWAYIGAKYGDRMVASLVRSAANPRGDLAGLARQLGTDPDTLTADWHRAIREQTQVVASKLPSLESVARAVISRQTGSGRYNIGPEISPDGQKMAFFSERDKFSFELFLADVETGRIERKLVRSASDPHFDSLEFLNSAGAWSPDARSLAITAVRAGRPYLVLIDPASGRVRREVPLPGLDDALGPSFSPDGRSVVLSGNLGGALDLYVLSLESGKLDRLTHDAYADLEPTFMPDGASVVFVTERFSTDLVTLTPGPLRMARIDLATRAATPISAFLKGKHLSPQVSADGRSLTFIAEPDGVSNLYRMSIDGGPITQVSAELTGVAGITSSSPALSASRRTGRLAFSVFQDDGETIYVLDEAETVSLVAPVPSTEGATLPGRSGPGGDVERLVTDFARGLPQGEPRPASRRYKASFLLDEIGQPTVSATISPWGGRATGSIGAAFSDMLGDRLFGMGAQIGGTLADLGGQMVYVSRKHRWNWAASVAATPDAWGYLTRTIDANGDIAVTEYLQRVTSRGPTLLTAYPFSGATRIEFAGDLRWVTLSQDTTVAHFDPGGVLIDQTRQHVVTGGPFRLAEARAALVHDTTFFGATAPIYGARYRLEAGTSTGTLSYSTWLADWRRYYMPKRPVTFGARVVHFGRYGRDAEQQNLSPVYLGYPELLHGYGIGSFSRAECAGGTTASARCAVFDSLIGSRMLVANLEVRAPLVGLFRGDLQYGRVPIDIAMFMDAGVAWTHATRPTFLGGTRDVLRSVGGAMRLNTFGFFILEVSAARALDRADRQWQWQIGIRQGF